MRYKVIAIVLIASTCIFAAYISMPESDYKRRTFKIDMDTQYQVAGVLDGDTIKIKIGKKNQTVRMLGIDTPETVDPRKPVQCFGKEASDMTKSMLAHRTVILKVDAAQFAKDKFGRLLAYVYRDDGLFMNEFLLKNGYAREYTYSKAYSLQKEFRSFEKFAQDQKNGLWEYCNDISK